MSDYKTYDWLDFAAIENKGQNPLHYNELNDKRIKDAVDKQMKAKNYRVVSNKGDLELHYHIVVEDKTTVISEPADLNTFQIQILTTQVPINTVKAHLSLT